MNSCPFKTMAMRIGLGAAVMVSSQLSAFSGQLAKSGYWVIKGRQKMRPSILSYGDTA
jgi:hypothetical protein